SSDVCSSDLQERQHHQYGKHHRKMLLAMPVVVLKVVALVFQRIEGLVFNLPPGATSPHEVKDIPFVYPQVCDPTEVLDLVLAHLPVLDKIDPHTRICRIERHVIDKAEAMDHPCGAVVSLIRGDPSSVVRCLHLLE